MELMVVEFFVKDIEDSIFDEFVEEFVDENGVIVKRIVK